MYLLPQISLLLCSLFIVTNAGYYSEGWKPGQAVKSITSEAPSYTPGVDVPKEKPPSKLPPQKLGFFDMILTSGPINSLLNSVGVNMTQKIVDAEEERAKFWDRRIPLITDENYEDLIVKAEPNSDDEVWFVIM